MQITKERQDEALKSRKKTTKEVDVDIFMFSSVHV